MKIFYHTISDNSNSGYRQAQMLKQAGHEVMSFAGCANPLGYPETLPIVRSGSKINKAYREADLIWNSQTVPLDYSKIYRPGIPSVASHSGTPFRQNPEKWNKLYADCHTVFNVTSDLYLVCSKHNRQLLYPPIDRTHLKRPKRKLNSPLRIGHLPSRVHDKYCEVKGTSAIRSAVEKVKQLPGLRDFEFITRDKPVKWLEHLEQVATLDVVIETCMPTQGGKPYGEFGQTCLEASYMHCIVISNSVQHDIYRDAYGPCPLRIANDEHQVIDQLRALLLMTDSELDELRDQFHEWIETNHTYEPTYERVEKILGDILHG